MILKKLEKPINRFGFVLFCFSLGLCFFAYLFTYKTGYSSGLKWLGYLALDSSYRWQQTVFRLGLAGAFVGAILAWNLLDFVKRIDKWVRRA